MRHLASGHWVLLILAVLVCCGGVAMGRVSVLAESPPPLADAQSRTGPTPPPLVLARDRAKAAEPSVRALDATTLPAPAYHWWHGCGPTSVGMVLGYYDGLGYVDLIPGSAEQQTYEVNQAIASGGDASDPFPPGSERHYEDYASPQDHAPEMWPDAYITAGREPHANDSIADHMYTSRSSWNNYYGWSWASHLGPAFVAYVNQRNPAYAPTYQLYVGANLNWPTLTGEIDAGRPMVFLVDTDGNGGTDHFVTVIGYRATPQQQYACLDTWYSEVRWEDFRPMAPGAPWGVWGAWALHLAPVPRYVLDVTTRGEGAVTRVPDEPSYAQGVTVTLTAVPSSGWAFGGWDGDATGSANPLVVTMTRDRTVAAWFYDPTTLQRRLYLPVAHRPG